MFRILDESAGDLLALEISGKLTKEDYQAFHPLIDKIIDAHKKIRLMVKISDLEGMSARALWEDLKLDVKHYDHFRKIAIVGDDGWQRILTEISEPFTTAEVRYFAEKDEELALEWI